MQRGEKRKRNRGKEESRVKENIVEEGKKRGKQSLCEKGCTTVRGRTRSRVEEGKGALLRTGQYAQAGSG